MMAPDVGSRLASMRGKLRRRPPPVLLLRLRHSSRSVSSEARPRVSRKSSRPTSSRSAAMMKMTPTETTLLTNLQIYSRSTLLNESDGPTKPLSCPS